MEGLREFLAMGGYGFYVWTSYAVVAVVLILNWAIPHWRERALRRRVEARATGDSR